MNVESLPGRKLDDGLLRTWADLRASNPALRSSCFAPEFTQTIASVRDDVEVAVISEEGRAVGLLPFQRDGKVGSPVGGMLSDFHGLICAPEFTLNPVELLKGCGLVAWDFDHLIASQKCFAPFHRYLEPSPQMDLSRGFEAYAAERRAAGSEQIKKCGNLTRRLEREMGPVRFVAHNSDPAALRQVLAWKSQQYREQSGRDLFQIDWVRAAVERIHAVNTPEFAGRLSLLYAGDRLVAGHFGMKSGSVWHYWFPSYDAACSLYSPGLVLLLKLAEHAASEGVRTIDLGKGLSLYKERLMSTSVMVADGSVETPSWLRVKRTFNRSLRRCVRGTGLAATARAARGWLSGKRPVVPEKNS